MKHIIITTGDLNGVGFEITAKSLNALGPNLNSYFSIYTSNNQPQYFDLLKKNFKLNFIDHLNQRATDPKIINIITSSQRPTHWVEDAVVNYKTSDLFALVTGPLSKTESFETHSLRGHTELFRSHFKNNIFMSFVGKQFNTLLITDHLPLREALDRINTDLYLDGLSHLDELPLKNNDIALVGINPHAGESGLLGKEEDLILNKLIEQYDNKNYNLSLPLPADTAFLKKNWEKYALFICPFHDVGLSAFKTVHGLSDGIQVSLGLPFIRTSVDHGTGYDIYNTDKAEYGSMKMAIDYVLKRINK